MSIEELSMFLEKVKNDKEFKKNISKEADIKKSILYESFEEQKSFLKDKIIPLAKKKGFHFELDDIFRYFFESGKSSKLNDDELENVSGGVSFKRFSSFLMAFSLFALSSGNVFGIDKSYETPISTDSGEIIKNIDKSKEESVNYQTIDDILTSNPDLHKIDESYPLNEVDNMIFSTVVYLPFLKVIPKIGENKEHITIKEYVDKLLEVCGSDDDTNLYQNIDENDIHTGEIYSQKTSSFYSSRVEFLKKIAKCERYKDIKIGDYKVEFNPNIDSDDYCQFAALTFTLENGEKIVAFRGTDGTQAGWKENFRTFWESEAPVRKLAASYLSDVINLYPDQSFSVSGHSKGGGLAVYAFLKNLKTDGFLEKIKNVYNFDGPGVQEEIIENDKKQDEYKKNYDEHMDEIIDKILIFVPQDSIIASIMDNENFNHYIVMSKASGFGQHNLLSWEVNPDFIKPDTLKFRYSERTIISIVFKEAWNEMSKNMDKTEFQHVINKLYDFYNKNDLSYTELSMKENVKRIFYNYISGKSVFEILKLVISPSRIINLPEKEYNEFADICQVMTRAMLNSFWNHHKELNLEMQLSEKSLNTIKKLKDSNLSKGKILAAAWTLTIEYIKKIGIFHFIKSLIW